MVCFQWVESRFFLGIYSSVSNNSIEKYDLQKINHDLYDCFAPRLMS